MAIQINTQLLPVKLFYFFYYGGISCLMPCLPHYLKQEKGFTPIDVTTILGSVPFLVIFTKPISGHIADKTRSYRTTLLVSLLIGTVFMCLVSFVPRVSTEISLNSSCTSDRCNQSSSAAPGNHFYSYEFWLIAFFLNIAKALGLSISYTIMDALTLMILKNRTEDYGKQRMWMSVGLASSLLVVSLTMDSLKSEGRDSVNYAPAFVGFIICISLSALCVVCVKCSSPKSTTTIILNPNKNDTQIKSKKTDGLITLLPHLRSSSFILFLSMAFVCGMNFGMSAWLAPFYLKVNLGASQTGIGCAVIFVCASTMAAFFVSGKVVSKLGHEITLSFCLIAYGIRALFWSLLNDPWLSLPIEILFGLCIGFWLPTMGSYACKLAGNGNKASAQSVLSAAYDGFGVGVGNLISGWLYQHQTGRKTWSIFAAFTGLCGVAYLIISLTNLRLKSAEKIRQPKMLLEAPYKHGALCVNLNDLRKETTMV